MWQINSALVSIAIIFASKIKKYTCQFFGSSKNAGMLNSRDKIQWNHMGTNKFKRDFCYEKTNISGKI